MSVQVAYIVFLSVNLTASLHRGILFFCFLFCFVVVVVVVVVVFCFFFGGGGLIALVISKMYLPRCFLFMLGGTNGLLVCSDTSECSISPFRFFCTSYSLTLQFVMCSAQGGPGVRGSRRQSAGELLFVATLSRKRS